MTPQEVLLKAADYIEQHGLPGSEMGGTDNDCLCVAFSCLYVSNERLARAACDLISARISTDESVAEWSDRMADEGRDAEVVATMREAARGK